MTVPEQYEFAAQAFGAFMRDAREAAGLTSNHQTYTMVQGVFQAFRRRLEIKDAIRFAQVLPPILRAIFVADWNVDDPVRPFADRATMTADVQGLRGDHNVAPDTSIEDVARALRRHVDRPQFERVLASLPPEAAAFWRV